MPALRVDDPLVPLAIRVPKSLLMEYSAQAIQANCTLSDLVRRQLNQPRLLPLGKTPPLKRRPVLKPASGVSPELLRQVASIGSNLNQLARAVNTGSVSGAMIESVLVLARLQNIESQLIALSSDRAGVSGAH